MKTKMKVVCVAVLLGLGVQPDAFSQEVPPERALEMRQALIAWLECEECTEGQLEALLKQGELAVPSLAAALRYGPSPASLERVQGQLEQTYRELLVYSQTHDEVKLELKEDEFVKLYLDNYRASHAARAAEALGMVGGELAKATLDSASRLRFRADVLAVIQESARRLNR